jgi:hypothetical protein
LGTKLQTPSQKEISQSQENSRHYPQPNRIAQKSGILFRIDITFENKLFSIKYETEIFYF